MFVATAREVEALRTEGGRAVGDAVVKVEDDAATSVYARRILKSSEAGC